MRFGLDDDREALRSTARDLLAELCPASVVRAAWEQAPDPAVWQALADAGALAMLVPVADGGLGLDETYLVPVVEEAGRAALPHPLTATALVAAPLGVTGRAVTTDLGTTTRPSGSGGVVPAATTGRRAAAGATTGHGSSHGTTADPAATTEHRGSGGIVPAAAFADAILLCSGGELRLYEAGEVDVEPVETVDASRHCGLVTPRAAGRLVTDDPEAVAAAFHRGVLGTAAELLGLSRAMLDLTVAYTQQRRQFGRPIGSFQAVKHHLANARIQIEFAAPAVLYAAYAVAHLQPDASRSVSQAKWQAGTAAAVAGRAALQCHGAIGYTTEHDLHLYLKRSWALARSWGGTDFHADRVAAEIGF